MKTTLYSIILVLCIGLFSIVSADQLDDAVSWMHDNELTIFDNKTDFQATRGLRRDEAAKFYLKFAKLLGKTTYINSASECRFSDLHEAWPDLKDVIIESCRLGLFKGNKGKFRSQDQLTNAQAVTVLVRLLIGPQSEVGLSHRSENYYVLARQHGLIHNMTIEAKDAVATRGNVAIIIWQGNSVFEDIYGEKSVLVSDKSLSYYNSGAGFGLEFPKERGEYTEQGDIGGVDFSLGQRQMFYIYIQPVSEYNQYGAPQSFPKPIFLGKNNTYVFWYNIFPIGYRKNDNPSSEMKKRIAEIDSILKSFYITKKTTTTSVNQQTKDNTSFGIIYRNKITKLYNSQGNQTQEIYHQLKESSRIPLQKYERSYNEKGKQNIQYTYYRTGSSRIIGDIMQRGSVTYEYTKIERSYDIKDNVIEQISYNGNGESRYPRSPSYKKNRSYDNKGNIVEEIGYHGNGSIYHDDGSIGSIWNLSHKTERSYDNKNNIIQSTNHHQRDGSARTGGFKKNPSYDDKGNVVEEIVYRNGPARTPSSKNEYTYDSKKNKILEIRYTWDGSARKRLGKSKTDFFYDSIGNKIQYITYNRNGSTRTPIYKTDRLYDSAGNQVQSFSYSRGGSSLIQTFKTERSYDTKGNKIQEILYQAEVTDTEVIPWDVISYI